MSLLDGYFVLWFVSSLVVWLLIWSLVEKEVLGPSWGLGHSDEGRGFGDSERRNQESRNSAGRESYLEFWKPMRPLIQHQSLPQLEASTQR